MCPPQLSFCRIKKAYFILNLNLKMNLETHTNQKTCVWRVNIYITSIHMSIDPMHMSISHSKFLLHSYSHSSSRNHIICPHDDKVRATTLRGPATCSRSCRDRFSNCVASRTCPPLLAHSRHRRIFPQHDNSRRWQTYKYRLLFDWCLYCLPFPFTTIL